MKSNLSTRTVIRDWIANAVINPANSEVLVIVGTSDYDRQALADALSQSISKGQQFQFTSNEFYRHKETIKEHDFADYDMVLVFHDVELNRSKTEKRMCRYYDAKQSPMIVTSPTVDFKVSDLNWGFFYITVVNIDELLAEKEVPLSFDGVSTNSEGWTDWLYGSDEENEDEIVYDECTNASNGTIGIIMSGTEVIGIVAPPNMKIPGFPTEIKMPEFSETKLTNSGTTPLKTGADIAREKFRSDEPEEASAAATPPPVIFDPLYEPIIHVTTNSIFSKDSVEEFSADSPYLQKDVIQAFIKDSNLQEMTVVSTDIGFTKVYRKTYKQKPEPETPRTTSLSNMIFGGFVSPRAG